MYTSHACNQMFIKMQVLMYAIDHVTGTVKGAQPNTYDVAMYGVNTFIGSLYLCALRSIKFITFA